MDHIITRVDGYETRIEVHSAPEPNTIELIVRVHVNGMVLVDSTNIPGSFTEHQSRFEPRVREAGMKLASVMLDNWRTKNSGHD